MDNSKMLQQIIGAAGWSQEVLAAKLGVSFATLNSWINGRSIPQREVNKRAISQLAAEILGTNAVDVSYLLETKTRALTYRLTAKELISNHELLDRITLNLTYHTNTIEGSTMTMGDVREVLFDNKVLSNRTQIEQREAVNHRVAMEYILELLAESAAMTWTADLIRAVHLRLMTGVISNAGGWRNHGVRIAGVHVPLANHVKIPDLIDDLCSELNAEAVDPVATIAKTHARFEQIHPFSDGNGRTGRLIMFALALQCGLVPPIITREKRSAYYKYLEIAQTKEEYALLEQMIASEIIAIGGALRGA